MDELERTETTSQCPFKGTAHYFSLSIDGGGKGGERPDYSWSCSCW